MNPYNFAMLLFSFGSIFVGLFVWLKRQDSVGWTYFLTTILGAIWALGFALMISENISYEAALFSARFADTAALFIPTVWLHLTLLLSDRLESHRRLLKGFYFLTFVIACFAFSPIFVSKVKPIMQFKYWLHPGPIFHLFTAMFFVLIPYGFVQLYARIKTSQEGEKTQLKGFFIATFFGFFGGGLSILPNYDIAIPQHAIFLMPIYPFVTAYFMIRHRLFDIEQAIQSFQREKLATIGLIAASINHEIRNPLYAVKSLLESHLESLEEGMPRKEPKEVSERALKQVTRALDVITKLNRFAKPSGDPPHSAAGRQEANIPEAIQNVLDLVAYEFELDKIHIQNNIPKDLPLIQADQRQLEEILFNLIVNACHAMSASVRKQSDGSAAQCGGEEGVGGTLEISASCHSGMTDKVTIEITDTGTGIPPEQAKHLFEPFHTTKGDKGTGLGLYITKQLVERNGGKITVKTQEGTGTSFLLEFKSP